MNWSRRFLGGTGPDWGSPPIKWVQEDNKAPIQITSWKYKMKTTLYRCLVLIILIGLLGIPACKSEQDLPEEITPSTSPQEQATSIPKAEPELTTLGLVINENYQPVVNAAVGENQLITDHNGVVTGTLLPNQAGLIPVKAAGYVPGYGTGIQISDNYQFMIVQLTGVDAIYPIPAEGEAVLTLGDMETPRLQAHISAVDVADEQAVLRLTEINPISLPEPWMDGANSALNPLYSFSIDAVDRWGESLPLDTSGQILIANQGGDVSQMVLAYFDPLEGSWSEIPDACQRVDDQYLTCTLPHFSGFSLFGPGSGSGLTGSGQTDAGGGNPAMDAWAAYYTALAQLASLYHAAGQSGQMPDESTLANAIENLKNAAERLANESSPEIGKTVLGQAAGHALAAGQSAAANALLDGARNLIDKIAKDLLKDDDCGKISELLNTYSQAISVGGMQDIADQLLDKHKKRQEECNVWKGTIHYYFILDNTWPNNPKWEFYSGSSAWTEVHQVTISIDPESGAVDGDSIVTLNMPDAEYRYTEVSDCGPVHNHQHMETGGSGSAVLSFDGSYQSGVFSIGSMGVVSSSPVSMTHHSYYALTYAPVPPPNCVPWPNKDISRTQIAEYTSQLIHGFFGSPEPPDLQTMLNTGTRSQSLGMEVISGTQDLSYSIGANLSPLIPVRSGTVSWRFYRVNQAGK